jgi:hypothetical protein
MSGFFGEEVHFWCLASADGERFLLDVTATQFFADAPAVAVLYRGDPAVGCYHPRCIGAAAQASLHAADRAEGLVLAERVRARLQEAA